MPVLDDARIAFLLLFVLLRTVDAQPAVAPDDNAAPLLAQDMASDADAFDAALNRVFTLQSQAGSASNLFTCRRRTLALMQRQGIPTQVKALRVMADAELFRIGIMAALAGLGSWVRDGNGDALVVDDRGALIPARVPSEVEGDVTLCIICALLTVIAVFHVILPSE